MFSARLTRDEWEEILPEIDQFTPKSEGNLNKSSSFLFLLNELRV